MSSRLFFGMMQNMFPQMAADAKDDIDMSPQQMDNVIKFQLGLRHPRYLDEQSLKLAGIVDHEALAKQVYKILVKKGYLLLPPPTTQDQDRDPGAATPVMTVNTHKIDRHFSHHFSIISVHAHRKLVSLLFFWEEEVNRWRMLDSEENEIQQALESAIGGHGVQDLGVALESVRMKKMLLPSQRAEGASTVFPPKNEPLPSYQASTGA
jgi:hypothetical protein